jgi:hypothetical protein
MLLVVGVSFVVGHFAARARTGYFDWELASIFGTALGTTLLAIATGALAYTTTEEQEARERPLVLLVDAIWGARTETEGAIMVTLRNVGLGPALRIEVHARYDDQTVQPTITSEIVPVLMVGELVRLTLTTTFAVAPSAAVRPDGFPISGTYRDRSQLHTHPIITDWKSSQPLAMESPIPFVG